MKRSEKAPPVDAAAKPLRRILVIDDNRAIQEDFRKILGRKPAPAHLSTAEAVIFGAQTATATAPGFELSFADQGEEAYGMVQRAMAADRPYAMAFIDVRMPPGWDGIETTARLWTIDPHLQVVICTAYSDYSWSETMARLGQTDRLVILKKPFDEIEALQLAVALTEKWELGRQARRQLADLEQLMHERTRELHLAQGAAEAAIRAQGESPARLVSGAGASKGIGPPPLAAGPLMVPPRNYAETARSNPESLMTVLNDILDLWKIEAGKLTFEAIDFDLRDLVEGTLELLAESGQAKGLELIGVVADGTPTALRGDPQRLRQILLNLVGNAIKFTAHGEIVVRASVDTGAAGETTAQFEVRDTGIGIAPEKQAGLFEPLTAAEGSARRKYDGTGLGLALSRRLAELMHGEMGVSSEPGQGSVFWFSARLDRAVAPPPAVPSGDLAGKHVLVVVENATYRAVLHHQLAGWGARDGEATHGVEAVRLLRAAAAAGNPFSVVLIDRQITGMDGLDLARAIKAHPEIAATRLVLLAAQRTFVDQTILHTAGIDECLIKPVRQARLLASLQHTGTVPD